MLRHSIWLLMLAFVVGCGGGDGATTTTEDPADTTETADDAADTTDDGASVDAPAVNLVSYTLKVPGMT